MLCAFCSEKGHTIHQCWLREGLKGMVIWNLCFCILESISNKTQGQSRMAMKSHRPGQGPRRPARFEARTAKRDEWRQKQKQRQIEEEKKEKEKEKKGEEKGEEKEEKKVDNLPLRGKEEAVEKAEQ